MTKDVMGKIAAANEKMKDVGAALLVYRTSLKSAAEAFEELASSCEAIIAQPFIEVDTRELDG